MENMQSYQSEETSPFWDQEVSDMGLEKWLNG